MKSWSAKDTPIHLRTLDFQIAKLRSMWVVCFSRIAILLSICPTMFQFQHQRHVLWHLPQTFASCVPKTDYPEMFEPNPQSYPTEALCVLLGKFCRFSCPSCVGKTTEQKRASHLSEQIITVRLLAGVKLHLVEWKPGAKKQLQR